MTTDVADKWGDAIAGRGFAQVPNYLLLLNQFIEKPLSPVELLILIQLVGAWWKKDVMPFPSMATLAVRCGVSDRQVQRSINELVKRDLIVRTQRHSERGVRSNNLYDLKPLIEMLNAVAKAYPNGFPRGDRKTKNTPIRATKTVSIPKIEIPLGEDGKPLRGHELQSYIEFEAERLEALAKGR